MDISTDNISGMIFRRVIRDDLEELSFDCRMLSVLVELDGKKTLALVAKKIGLNMATIREVISRLLQFEIIEPVEDTGLMLGQDFFDFLNDQLSLAIGPVAEVLVADAIEDIGLNSPHIQRLHAAELIDILAREIPREHKRVEFQQAMLEKIRETEP